MDTCYCVFWFPSIFHREKRLRSMCNYPVSIADDDDKHNLFLDVKERLQFNVEDESAKNEITRNKEKKYDIVFTLTDQKGTKIESVFRCVFQTKDNFVVYSYDRDKLVNGFWDRFGEEEQKKIIEMTRIMEINCIEMKYHPEKEPNPDDEQIKNYTIDRLLVIFYHYAEQLFHEHETHCESDSKYAPYYYSKEHEDGSREYLREVPLLSIKNNSAINWYIDQFEKQIVNNAENISYHYIQWSKEFQDIIKLRERVNKALCSDNYNEIGFIIGELHIRNYVEFQLKMTYIPKMICLMSLYSMKRERVLERILTRKRSC